MCWSLEICSLKQRQPTPAVVLLSHSLINILSCAAVDPCVPIVMEFLGAGTGTQDWFLRRGEIMWIYTDCLSYDEDLVFELSE